ncbi:MAG: hypothetical protein RBT38_08545 [Bacteroidales bacterium]|jgi:hypothetical protein|nr:hypothetical protein [Bacteroidales bacterium]
MNKPLKISTVIHAMVIFSIITLAGCRQGGRGEGRNADQADISGADAELYEDLKQAEKIFYSLPSPLESAMLIKSAGARFDDDLLNPVENANNYNTNRTMALNLGIYTCDLSFASLYDQTQLIINYMNAAKKMADGLGILDAISDEDIERLESNIHNRDVIMEIVSQTYLNSNSYLDENGQPAIAAIVLTGGWIEGLFISTQLVDQKDLDGNKLVGRIIDQKLSIGNLMSLLEENQGHPAVDELIIQVGRIRTIFDRITLTATPVRTEYDQESNVTLLKSEVSSDMTPEVFSQLAATVAEIRNNLIK